MGSVKGSDIPEEQKMWTDVWNLRKKYYYAEERKEWWMNFVADMKEMSSRYNLELCNKILIAIYNNARNKLNNNDGGIL